VRTLVTGLLPDLHLTHECQRGDEPLNVAIRQGAAGLVTTLHRA